tara:strand:+ start:1016 stop:1123 length:108 start_codon:yes stop_codon:yes gene_type:complete
LLDTPQQNEQMIHGEKTLYAKQRAAALEERNTNDA